LKLLQILLLKKKAHHISRRNLLDLNRVSNVGRLKNFILRIENITSDEKIFDFLNDSSINELKTIDVSAEIATQAEQIASANFRGNDNLLPGTGEQVWKELL
jgi:hypothetical protein